MVLISHSTTTTTIVSPRKYICFTHYVRNFIDGCNLGWEYEEVTNSRVRLVRKQVVFASVFATRRHGLWMAGRLLL